MSSPCLAGGRTYTIDLDLLKSPSPSSSPSPSPSPSPLPSPSSTLSGITISTKKPRAPRKRPNQSYSEAAAILSAIHPGIFPSSALPKLRNFPSFPFSDSSDLLLHPPPNPPKLAHPTPKPCPNHTPSSTTHFSTPVDEDINAESMLDEEIGEGIDSILGSPSTSATIDTQTSRPYNVCLNAYIASLVYHTSMRHALRRRDNDGDWWRSPRVPVRDLVPKLHPLEKTKKKSNTNANTSSPSSTSTTTTKSRDESTNVGLNLKLNYEGILEEWSHRGSPYGDSGGSPESSADARARLAQIDLFPETGNGLRETSLQRYKEKRRNRLFFKKIRYEVRKVNADQRPRMKGRFVKRPSLLGQTIEEESS
ncbi:hypothetical protein J5N97_026728 [Dioscorea zingiberensis]|uniref:CCT domain-containing protein n=1 Tax=Dioscorea zingiberensis TaxID=325984 RepID=A0A9D5C3B5_9LILI|nr:hypothetical protein J5N97_026728 [Dioscorea zingiberensis]